MRRRYKKRRQEYQQLIIDFERKPVVEFDSEAFKAWLADPDRKEPELSFPSGPTRDAATALCESGFLHMIQTVTDFGQRLRDSIDFADSAEFDPRDDKNEVIDKSLTAWAAMKARAELAEGRLAEVAKIAVAAMTKAKAVNTYKLSYVAAMTGLDRVLKACHELPPSTKIPRDYNG